MAFEKGWLEALEGDLEGEKVVFMFNPAEYAISKSNDWTTKGGKGKNVPHYEFGGGKPRTLTLELFFDATMPGPNGTTGKSKDVRNRTNQLFNFMMVDTNVKTKDKNSQMGRPPKCQLRWGGDSKFQFPCYLQQCNVKYTMFDDQGWPIRATVNLTLLEAVDKEERLPTNPTSQGDPGRRVRRVEEGDRLDWIAYQEYGDAQAWRRIAEANRITDPLNLPPGMQLAIPPL